MGPKLLLLFIVGDILGTGIYAVTGSVAKQVGGVVWLPFLVAFVVATITAFSYLELVTKYPRAAGAALYAHKAFGVHFVTFLICFAVMCSGITSASTASRAFATNLEAMVNVVRQEWLGLGGVEVSDGLTTVLAILFMILVAAINLRGVAESVYANIVLTCIELSGLLLVIFVGVLRLHPGQGRPLPGGHVRHPGRQGHLHRGHRGDLDRVLRHGRLRGLGQHGRGGQRARAGLPQDHAHRAGDHRPDLHPGVDLGHRPGAGRGAR